MRFLIRTQEIRGQRYDVIQAEGLGHDHRYFGFACTSQQAAAKEAGDCHERS